MQDALRGFSFEKVILIFRKEVCKDIVKKGEAQASSHFISSFSI